MAWDGMRRELLLARDKFGQNTLYIREFPNLFLCSSELTPLLDAFHRCSLDVESAVRYLFVGQPLNGRTLATEVTKLKAAHCLHWRPGTALITRRYYSPLRHDSRWSPNKFQRREIQSALDDAITASADGKCKALLLSGGVDSSYIGATIAERKCGSLEAYTIAFEGLPEANETEYAALVAKKLAVKHHVITLALVDAVTHLNAILDSAEPCSAWATISHRHLLQSIASRHHKHLLSGLGADEVFGGYSAYLKNYAQLRLHEKAWTAPGVSSLFGVMSNPADARSLLFSGIPRFFDSLDLTRALHAPFNRWNTLLPDISFYRQLQAMKSNCHYFEMMIAHECEHRIPELLFCGFEPISKEFGISTSYPFLSPHVVEQVIALGATLRFRPDGDRWKNKVLLREFAASKLPSKILDRNPMSYNAPILPWLGSRPFAKIVVERLHESPFLDLGIVRKQWLPKLKKGVLRCINSGAACRPDVVNQIWALLTISSWYHRWIRR
jgi:asparagine synthase (glutamine-hydrolysing)